MKSSFSEQIPVGGSRRITVLASAMALLLTSIHLAQGGTFTQMAAGTNVYNLYAYNGANGMSDGIELEPPFSGSPVPTINFFPATQFAGTIPLTGTPFINSAAISGASGAADAQFTLGNTSTGANPTGVSSTGGIGLTLFLNNPNSTADEVRFDWNAIYSYSGTSSTTLGSPSSPLMVIISGNLSAIGSYYALAGGETIYDGSSSTTVTIGAGTAPGDGFTQAGLGAGPWNGAVA
ncbi:MAG TPA: hypothetical protein VKJ65_04280, partial [Phycisphaerae bacterium]|nr:hypothetical protein [Phycisphaerae bacterium]